MMPGDMSRSYKGPKDGSVPSWMDEPSEPTLARPNATAPVIKSFSQSTRDTRCLEVWFDQEVTDGGREWLLEAIDEKALRDCSGWSTEELMVPNLGWEKSLNEQVAEHPPFDNPRDPFAAPDRLPKE